MTATRPTPAPLAVLGAGAWGSVLACLLAENGHPVRLWSRSEATADRLARTRSPGSHAPELHLPALVTPTADLARAVTTSEGVFLAVPVAAVAELAQRMPPPAALVSCAKGLAGRALDTPTTEFAMAHPDTPVAVLSGPNLSGEIARGLPAAATLASTDAELASAAQRWLQRPRFRVYTDDDPLGLEVAGAYKNVIALAAGMSDALGFGINARGALVARGLAEMVRLVTHLGGRPRTCFGLGGVGDLVATCSSPSSRNHVAGTRLADGASVAELRREGLTAEGIPTVRAVRAYAGLHSVALPIAEAVHGVAFEDAYCNSPLCAPFMTGRLPSRIGAYDNAAEFPDMTPTFAHYLRALSYRTTLCGKMHFVGADQRHGFEERLTTDIYPSDFGWVPDWDDPDKRFSWYQNELSVLQAGTCATSNQLDYDDEVGFRAVRHLHDVARVPLIVRAPGRFAPRRCPWSTSCRPSSTWAATGTRPTCAASPTAVTTCPCSASCWARGRSRRT